MLYFVLVSLLFFLGGGGIFVLTSDPAYGPTWLVHIHLYQQRGREQKMFESFLYNFTKYIWIFFYPIISRMNLDLESKRIFFNIII